MKIEEIEIDNDIYPELRHSNETVNRYVEKKLAGENFPPITVEKNS